MRTIHTLRSVTAAALTSTLSLTACSPSNAPTDASIVLYTSADDVFAHAVVKAFEAETGLRVELVGDTEATKTTGLVTRLQAEKDNPRADVWWSSEPMGTMLLAESGVLEPGAMRDAVPADWPKELLAADGSWVGFGERGRVFVYSADRVNTPPTTLAELTTAPWTGKVGMARPQFGTTRGHMALLHARWGEQAFEAWLTAMQANGMRLYDGNARVVRAVYEGEIDIALTDTDDVWVAIANNWPVNLAWEAPTDHPQWPSLGTTTIPNTVAVVRGSPNPEGARRLAAFLASEQVERLLAASDSRNIPVHPAARAEFSELVPVEPAGRPDYTAAHTFVGPAMDACQRVLSGP